MTGLVVLVLAAAGAAYGAWASLKNRPPLWASAAAAALFAAAGVVAILVSWIAGDGIVLPGLQLSPGLKAYYLSEAAWDLAPSIGRWLLLVAPLAHLVLVAARRDQEAIVLPLPATCIFVWFLFSATEVGASVKQARGPERVAYLTTVSTADGARLILATGGPFATFLRIAHVHETASVPPKELHLYWTNDGKGLVVRVHEEKDAAFAVDLDGNTTGVLPVEAREWPGPDYVPGDVKERFSRARMEVAGFIREHKGLAAP